jgi:hypothetical protein
MACRPPHRLLIGAVLLLAAARPAPAPACSVNHIDTAEQITAKAEQIVRAQVIAATPGPRERPWSGQVTFKVLEVLKGGSPGATLTLAGQTARYDGPNDQKPPYHFVRPGGRHGNCSALDYRMGGQFLLFLKDGSPYWSALAATNEEVTGEDDPWVRWVRQRLSGEKRRK